MSTRGRRLSIAALGVVAMSIAAAVPAVASEAAEGGLWYFTRGKVHAAQDAGLDGSGVTIAVIDTQVNPDAPGLRGSNLDVRASFCFDESGERYDPVSTD